MRRTDLIMLIYTIPYRHGIILVLFEPGTPETQRKTCRTNLFASNKHTIFVWREVQRSIEQHALQPCCVVLIIHRPSVRGDDNNRSRTTTGPCSYREYARMRVCVCVRVCVRACVCVGAWVCLSVWLFVRASCPAFDKWPDGQSVDRTVLIIVSMQTFLKYIAIWCAISLVTSQRADNSLLVGPLSFWSVLLR